MSRCIITDAACVCQSSASAVACRRASILLATATIWARAAQPASARRAVSRSGRVLRAQRPPDPGRNRASTATPTTQTGGLRLDSREALLKGGESGPAIVPGDPDDEPADAGDPSRRRTRRRCRRAAPKLPDAKIAALAQWIRDGARLAASGSDRRAAPAMPRVTADKAITAGAARVLVVPAARARVAVPAVARQRLGEDRHRSLHPRAAREGRAGAGRGRPIKRTLHPPRHARPHRAAADAGRGRRVREGRRRRTRSPRSSIACSRRRATAKRGAACGSTSRATARTIRAASIRRAAATRRIRTPISIATG